MSAIGAGMVKGWMRLGPRLLPFADAVSAELPLGRLLRLCLFQVTVGMAAVLLIGTLNRVMIVELGVPAWLVAIMVSRPARTVRRMRPTGASEVRRFHASTAVRSK